ncbi:hypothetical protein ACWEHA_35665 [Amycolatopsis nivea]
MTSRETRPCETCNHNHYSGQECADHQWTDACPYEGLDCPSDVRERKARQEAESRARYGDNPSLADFLPLAED